MNTLLPSLQDYPLSMLRAIADVRGVTLQSNAAREVAEQLATALAEPDNLLVALAGCSSQAHEALESLLRAGGRSPAAAFERRFGVIRRFGPGRLEREAPQRNPANATEELWYRGLVFRAFAQTPAGLSEFIYLPGDVAGLLPEPEAAETELQLPVTSAPPFYTSSGSDLLQDACSLLCLVQAGAVRLSAADDPLAWRPGSLAELNSWLRLPASSPAELAAPDSATPGALLLVLAGELGWLQARRHQLRLNAGPVRQWLETERGQQRRVLLDAWRDSAGWNDLCRTPALRCEQTGSWRNDPVDTRRGLLPLLAGLPDGRWLGLDDLIAAVKQRLPDFQRPDGDYDTWYIRQRSGQAFLRGFDCWEQVEGELLRFLLAGPLHWLGVIDLAGEEGPQDGEDLPRPALFRLTPAGAAWLAGEPAPAEPASGQIEVQADFAVLAPESAPLGERFRVARFTTWIENGPPFPSAGSGRTSRYRITQSGLRRAAAQGIDAGRVLAYLREQAGDALPANVAAALERWQA